MFRVPGKRSENAEFEITTRPSVATTATGTGIRAKRLLISGVRSAASPVPSLVIYLLPSWDVRNARHSLKRACYLQPKIRAYRLPRLDISYTFVGSVCADNRPRFPGGK